MKRIKATILNNTAVLENYFFMTVLQILNSLFYLLIYPFLIRTLGAESYGLYIFAFSISVFFVSLVQFGFDTPALKEISLYPKNRALHAEIVSKVFISKLVLFLLAIVIFVPLLFSVKIFRENVWLFLICFSQIISNILLPTWYFQGIQKMKIVTYIQLSLKIASLPLIFLLIKYPSDIVIFAAITISTGIIGGVVAMFILRYKNSIKISWVSIATIKDCFKDAIPFFLSSSMNTVKQQATSVLIGSFFTMSDVALYDLANKIFTIPATLTASINGALFPKLIFNTNKNAIRKILKYETIIGIGIIVFFLFFGKLAILFLGGVTMYGAYPILIILGFNILTPLLVSSYCSFIFVPNRLYSLIAKNQFVAFSVFFLVSTIGLFTNRDILVIPIAMLISGISEIIYCNVQIKNLKLL